jgi:hypothetical protein
MMRHQVADDAIEPELRQLREDFALVGNPRSEDEIEGRDAIGGDNEQVLAKIIDVADLTAPREGQTCELSL